MLKSCLYQVDIKINYSHLEVITQIMLDTIGSTYNPTRHILLQRLILFEYIGGFQLFNTNVRSVRKTEAI